MSHRLFILGWIGAIGDRANNAFRLLPGRYPACKVIHACRA
jgi:hypothetical protein